MKGFIYLLSCKNETDELYIGSTRNIEKRMQRHRTRTNTSLNMKLYKTIYNTGGFNNWTCNVLETVEYTDRIELLKRERYWIDTLRPKLNIQKPLRTYKEWCSDNPNYFKDWYNKNNTYNFEYYQKNKDRLKLKRIERNVFCNK